MRQICTQVQKSVWSLVCLFEQGMHVRRTGSQATPIPGSP